MGDPKLYWFNISPKDAQSLDLSKRLDIVAPHNEAGERCPWPWDPQQLTNAPMGQYHCAYCGAMVIAGIPHLDYSEEEKVSSEDTDGANSGSSGT